MMNVLTKNGIQYVFHYAPLHYLPFILRTQKLLSKTSLAKAGFPKTHLRSTSHKQDAVRGFGDYVHLTLDSYPPILKAKLRAGFPHFELKIKSEVVENSGFHLCRFNIAKTRYFKGAKQAPGESPSNGRYYDSCALPTARTKKECEDLFYANIKRSMIEVLIFESLTLPSSTVVTVFDKKDLKLAQQVLKKEGNHWAIELVSLPEVYKRNELYATQVEEFINQSLRDASWKGNGLEFDRV